VNTDAKFGFHVIRICEITRTVVERNGVDGPVTSQSEGQPVTVTVEYAGKELVVFDDEYGVGKFDPAPEIEPKP
jgi:hypothetical protein